MSTDAMGTIVKVLEKIKPKSRRPDDRHHPTFGKEYGDDAASWPTTWTNFHRQLKLVNDEKAKGSMQRESDIGNDSRRSGCCLAAR